MNEEGIRHLHAMSWTDAGQGCGLIGYRKGDGDSSLADGTATLIEDSYDGRAAYRDAETVGL